MGVDMTSYQYPYSTEYSDKGGEENHKEPESELVRSSVDGYEHPLFSPSGLKNTLNLNRILSNSSEKMIEGEIKPETIKKIMEASLKNKVPYEVIAFAMDFDQPLDKGDGGKAEQIAKKLKSYVDELSSSLGRQPLNSEVFMAFALEGASKVKTIIENAEKKPDEEAKNVGSKKDDYVLKKPKFDKEKKRTNKEVYQYFKKRMGVGNKTFPYTV